MKSIVIDEALGLADWVRHAQVTAPICACGCGGRVRVQPRHRQHGIPAVRHGHHEGPVRREFTKIRESGYILVAEAARLLGVSPKRLRNWEARGAIPEASRLPFGIHGVMVRVYTPQTVDELRKVPGLLAAGQRMS